MDQCMNCTVSGDIDACMKTPCSQHESWYAQTLKAQQRTWVGLQPHEIAGLVEEVDWYNFPMDLVRESEAKLKEKNT